MSKATLKKQSQKQKRAGEVKGLILLICNVFSQIFIFTFIHLSETFFDIDCFNSSCTFSLSLSLSLFLSLFHFGEAQ